MSLGTKVWGTMGIVTCLASFYLAFVYQPRTGTSLYSAGVLGGMGGTYAGLAIGDALTKGKDDER